MKNVEAKFLWFGLLAFTGTLIFSFIPTSFHLLDHNFSRVDFISDIRAKQPAGKRGPVPNHVASNVAEGDTAKPDFYTYKDIINYQRGKSRAIEQFTRALHDLKLGKRKTVRIAYLGDSFIEGDIITMDLRSMLQTKFGGAGVGFVPITSIAAGMRQTITQSFSSNWDDYSFKSKGDCTTIFLSGHIYSPENSTVSYRGVKHPFLDTFPQVYLLYKSAEPLSLTLNGESKSLPVASAVSKQLVASHVGNVSASFPQAHSTIYGFSFEPDTGLILDNYSFRGITGVEYRKMQPEFLAEINNANPYDLIIVQYGPNLLYKPEADNFSYYQKPMTKTIELLSSSFPQADILMLSTGDKAFRYDGEYKTAKGVIPLLETQQQIAAATGVNFWNLYLNMGGENSMIDWVEGDVKMANKDYTHVNFKGGKKIAELIYTTLIHAYEKNN